jgi:UDP-N-acetylmuramoyl-tripeptide--D-alanyl-D-alanine ligase
VSKINHKNIYNTLRKIAFSCFLGDKVFVLDCDVSNLNGVDWIVKKSMLPILIINNFEKKEELEKICKAMPSFGYLAVNSENKDLDFFEKNTESKFFTFGFKEGADFRVTDVVLTKFPSLGTNFKLNIKGMIVPIWLKGLFGKEEIYAALSSIIVGTSFNFNLIKISESLRTYSGVSGKMKLIKGIKKTNVLDNSDASSLKSFLESLKVTEEMPYEGRKIFILGEMKGNIDLVSLYEEIGKGIISVADVLITFGSGTKIISENAFKSGMDVEKIFNFDTIDQGKLQVQQIIKKGDFILVTGSKESGISDIVKEIKEV